MSDWATLIAAIASLLGAAGGIAGVVINARIQLRQQQDDAMDELQNYRLAELEDYYRNRRGRETPEDGEPGRAS